MGYRSFGIDLGVSVVRGSTNQSPVSGPMRSQTLDVVGEGGDVVPVRPVRVRAGRGVTVGGVGDVAWPSPGAPVHRVRLRGEVRHSASNTGAGGAVGLALVGGGRLRPPRPAAGAQGRVVAETGPSRENSTKISVHLPPHGPHLPVHVPGQGGGRGGAQGGGRGGPES